MHGCLIVSVQAQEYADAVNRLPDVPIELKICTSVEESLAAYTDQTILFGSPDLIAEVLPHMPKVDWVQSSWAGVTPLIAAERRDYILTGIKDVFGPPISEYVFGYILAHELKILQRLQAQQEKRWSSAESGTLTGKRLGIMGTGSIGQHIAKMAKNFGMSVAGLSRSGTNSPNFDKVTPSNELHSFLHDLDYLVSVLPQTAATDNLLDATALACLPARACVINVGRGNVIDDAALVSALCDQRLGGAVLDVFDTEPLPQQSPLWTTPNLLVTGHVAAMSHSSLIVPIFVDNYRRYSAGKPLKHSVDFAAGY